MCGAIAECTNTQGSYECNCVTGYSGDGRTCTGSESKWDYYIFSYISSVMTCDDDCRY